MILSREAAMRFPEIKETKKNLGGVTKTFACRRLSQGPGEVVVLHVLDTQLEVAGVPLPVGTLTLGHFWEARPYNVYHWLDGAGRTLGFYFNIAEATSLGEGHIEWQDLTLDVLALPGHSPRVLDREELPSDLPREVRERIEAAVVGLLEELPSLLAALESEADGLWQQVAGGPRAEALAP